MTAAVVKFLRGLLSSDGIFSFTGVVLVSQLDDRSRMTREFHVRICGCLGGEFPWATRRLREQFLSALAVGGDVSPQHF